MKSGEISDLVKNGFDNKSLNSKASNIVINREKNQKTEIEIYYRKDDEIEIIASNDLVKERYVFKTDLEQCIPMMKFLGQPSSSVSLVADTSPARPV